MIKRVQVYGHRCSGTNALIKLIEANFPRLSFTEEFGFKHWLTPVSIAPPSDVLVVIIARSPGEWLRSLHSKPWHVRPELKKLSFSQFVRAPWETIWDEDFWGMTPESDLYLTPIFEERCPATGAPFDNAVVMRTAKLKNWIETSRRAGASLFISHRALTHDPVGVLEQIAEAARVRPGKEWTVLTSYKGAGENRFVPKVYAPLNAEDRAHVDLHLDPAIERQFG